MREVLRSIRLDNRHDMRRGYGKLRSVLLLSDADRGQERSRSPSHHPDHRGYSTTRASESDVSALQARHHTDVDRIEEEMEVEGRRIREEIGDLKDSVHAIDKEQSAFRGQVREALRIPHD